MKRRGKRSLGGGGAQQIDTSIFKIESYIKKKIFIVCLFF